MELVFEVPGRDVGGYLLRQRTILEFQQVRDKPSDPETVTIMVNWLAGYVKVPEDREEAIAALWEASEEQIDELLASISGSGKVPPKIDGDSESG